ncbi:hypothetical protein EJ08DRAFT_322666 [Tothia fuscella]|uniref:Uncharacterized protein n=1 Tax=Tothia fuscella TaxID=1048955 RepID=A0A9P4TWK0_9PEZI|nr:hypothetical protein EJ08DRAFT_322666 [Tothia fuscella]
MFMMQPSISRASQPKLTAFDIKKSDQKSNLNTAERHDENQALKVWNHTPRREVLVNLVVPLIVLPTPPYNHLVATGAASSNSTCHASNITKPRSTSSNTFQDWCNFLYRAEFNRNRGIRINFLNSLHSFHIILLAGVGIVCGSNQTTPSDLPTNSTHNMFNLLVGLKTSNTHYNHTNRFPKIYQIIHLHIPKHIPRNPNIRTNNSSTPLTHRQQPLPPPQAQPDPYQHKQP